MTVGIEDPKFMCVRACVCVHVCACVLPNTHIPVHHEAPTFLCQRRKMNLETSCFFRNNIPCQPPSWCLCNECGITLECGGDIVRREKAVQGPQSPMVLALLVSRSKLFRDDSFRGKSGDKIICEVFWDDCFPVHTSASHAHWNTRTVRNNLPQGVP